MSLTHDSASVAPTWRARAARHRALLVLLALLLALDLTGLDWGLPHTIAPHPDDVAKPALEALQQRFLEPTKYPKLQLLWVASSYAPYLAWLWWRGELHLGGAADAGSAELLDDPVTVLSNLLYLARLTEVAAHLLAVLAVYLLALRLARARRPALLAAALFGLSPWVVFFTKTSTVDVPMVFWLATAMLAAVRVLERADARRVALFGVLCILAVSTKEQAAFYLAPTCLALGARLLAREGAARTLRLALPGLAGALLLWAALNDLLWAPSNFSARWQAWGADLGGWRDGVAGRPGAWELTRDTAVQTAAALGPGLVAAGFWGAWRVLHRPDRTGVFLLAQLAAYPVLLVGYLGFVQPRYMIPQALTAALLVAHASARVARGGSPSPVRARRVPLAAWACALVALLQAALMVDAFRHDPRAEATRWLTAHAAPGDELEYFQKINSLPGWRAAGLRAVARRDLDPAALAARAPAFVCVVGNERWNWDAAELAYAERLLHGEVASLGYRRVRFGRDDPDDTRWYLPLDLSSRLRPEVAILQRVEPVAR